MSFLRKVQLVAAALAAATLTGCITAEYGPLGEKSPYGYSDMRNTDGSYTIRVVSLNAQQAHEFWDRRAAEICGSTNFRKNIFRAEIPVITTTGYASNPYNPGYGGSYTQDAYGALVMEGYLHCEGETAVAAEDSPTTEPAVAPVSEAAPATQP